MRWVGLREVSALAVVAAWGCSEASGPTGVGFDPGRDQELRSDEGVVVTLPANALVTASGAAPEGNATAALRRVLGPTSVPTDMPGGFDGRDRDGQEVTLISYGVVEIAFRDAGGRPLDLRPGVRATIAIPAIAEGPDTMPLWWLDEARALWLEEGAVERRGDAYVGEVSHFSFWNADLGCDRACASGRLVDADGVGIGGALVVATLEETTCPGWRSGALGGATASTDAEGVFRLSSLVPASRYVLRAGAREPSTLVVPASAAACVDLGDLPVGEPAPMPGPLFDLVCSSWDGARQAVYRLDAERAARAPLGELGDLYGWRADLVLDERAERVYATGFTRADEGGNTLYELELTTGVSRSTRLGGTCCDVLAGVTRDGRLVSAVTDASGAHAVRLLDPTTGAATPVGTLATSAEWRRNGHETPILYYDRVRDAVLAVSGGAGAPDTLHVVELDGGPPRAVAIRGVSDALHLAGLGPDGALLALGESATGEIHVVEIDPSSGEATRRGSIRGIRSSNRHPVVDAAAGQLFVLGDDASFAPHVYRYELATGTTEARPIAPDQQCVFARQ
ncbi:MAG: hypothetical protein KF729_20195 [Sandaracinaceae bacterium]|nr:hypothetical protein [Sandaracinaceae bacterium]